MILAFKMQGLLSVVWLSVISILYNVGITDRTNLDITISRTSNGTSKAAIITVYESYFHEQ